MVFAVLLLAGQAVRVDSVEALRRAAAAAKPGTEIHIAPGQYDTFFAENLHGSEGKPIRIRAADPTRPPRFKSWQISKTSHLEIASIEFQGATNNGLNIDDGGSGKPSHHVRLRDLLVTDLSKGNHDGIKLSGIDDFHVDNCRIERWGGSAVDMVGCHRGLIEGSTFKDGGDNGVQMKGGTSDVTVRRCRFDNPGQRGVNLGGSTGAQFFRPADATFEAKNLTVEGCVFTGGVSPIAFVGVDGAVVRFNTIVQPARWVVRILQETTTPGFPPCRDGRFEHNLIVFADGTLSGNGVNVGPNTDPASFRFARNHWFCTDRPDRSRLGHPIREEDSTFGVDPKLDRTTFKSNSKAGAGAFFFSGSPAGTQ